MGESFYIFKSGELRRKDNNIVIKGTDGELKNLKSEVIDEIYLLGEVSMNTKLLNFLAQKGIIMHVFNYYGFYSGSFYPRESNISGCLLVNQLRKYDNTTERVRIAKEILKSASYNVYRNQDIIMEEV